jgi:hypothetical protein
MVLMALMGSKDDSSLRVGIDGAETDAESIRVLREIRGLIRLHRRSLL